MTNWNKKSIVNVFIGLLFCCCYCCQTVNSFVVHTNRNIIHGKATDWNLKRNGFCSRQEEEEEEEGVSFFQRMNRPKKSSLFGLKEWRAQSESSSSVKEKKHSLLLLPFLREEILIPHVGESRELIFKDGRFLELFEDCLDYHQSVVGMALMGDDGLLQNCILCEIRDFDVKSGYRGKLTMHVTLVAVGRAKIQSWDQMKPVLQATCTELQDTLSSSSTSLSMDDSYRLWKSQIETVVPPGQKTYQTSYQTALQQQQQQITTSSQQQKLIAASWALLSIVNDRSPTIVYDAFKSTNVEERLNLSFRILLEEKLMNTSDSMDIITDMNESFQ